MSLKEQHIQIMTIVALSISVLLVGKYAYDLYMKQEMSSIVKNTTNTTI
jgi:hypothetical protein